MSVAPAQARWFELVANVQWLLDREEAGTRVEAQALMRHAYSPGRHCHSTPVAIGRHWLPLLRD